MYTPGYVEKLRNRIRELEALLLSIRGYMYPGNVMPVPEQANYIVKWIDAAIPQSDATAATRDGEADGK